MLSNQVSLKSSPHVIGSSDLSSLPTPLHTSVRSVADDVCLSAFSATLYGGTEIVNTLIQVLPFHQPQGCAFDLPQSYLLHILLRAITCSTTIIDPELQSDSDLNGQRRQMHGWLQVDKSLLPRRPIWHTLITKHLSVFFPH